MFDVIFKLGTFFKENMKSYIISFITMIFSNLFRVLIPYIIGILVDYIVTGELTSPIFYQHIAVFIFSVFASYILEFIWSYHLFTGSAKLQRKIRTNLMDHFLKKRSIFYEKFRVGDLMARSTQDVRAIAETAGYGMMVLMDSSMFLVIIILMMSLTISWQLTLFSMLPMFILSYLFGKVGDVVEKQYTISQDAFSSTNNDVLEIVDGIRVVRAFVKEDDYTHKFEKQTDDLLTKNNRVAKANAIFMPLVKLFTGISSVISFGYGSFLVFKGILSVGDIVSFQMFLQMLIWPIISIGELTNVLRQGSSSMNRVEEVLQTSDEMESHGDQKLDHASDLSMESLSFQYPSSTVTNLKNINLVIPKGKLLGIVGKTGAGKTTLLRQLLSQYPRGEGNVHYGENDMKAYSSLEFSRLIGYVPQDHILFSRSVKENIAFGKPDATEAEIIESIRLASFTEDLERMELGLDTLVGEKGVSISGGQKQRISLARALIKEPEILILDDSLSAVDAKTEQNIIANIQKVRADKTTIISTHRLSAIKEADEIIVMDDGEIIERGTHDELLKLQGWYHGQYHLQELKEGDE